MYTDSLYRIVPYYAKENTYSFIYARAKNDEVILCLFNPANREEKAEFELNIEARKLELLAGDKLNLKNKKGRYSVEMAAISYALFKLKF